MTYLTVKYIKGNPYLYEVRSVREGDRVRQVFVRYLGRADTAEGIERQATFSSEKPVSVKPRRVVSPVVAEPEAVTPEVTPPVTEEVRPSDRLKLFHGTKADFADADIEIGKRMFGIHLTTDEAVAKIYGDVKAYELTEDAKTLDLSDGQDLWEFMKKEGILDAEDIADVDLENYILGGQLFQYDISSKTSLADDVAKTAQSLGYDLVKMPDDLGSVEGENVAYVVVNKRVLAQVKQAVTPEVAKEPWMMAATSKEFADLTIDELDRAAFGFARDDITTLQPEQLNVKWEVDYNNAIEEQEASGLTKEQWAEKIDLSEPIDVIYEDGKFKVDDGYHRYYAATILNKPLNVSLEIKDKPHRAIVEKAISEGKPVPIEVLAGYPDLTPITPEVTPSVIEGGINTTTNRTEATEKLNKKVGKRTTTAFMKAVFAKFPSYDIINYRTLKPQVLVREGDSAVLYDFSSDRNELVKIQETPIEPVTPEVPTTE